MKSLRFLFVLALGLALGGSQLCAQAVEDSMIELVDPNVFRVCADPRDLPFSNEAGEGFENKISELFARKLGKSLAYTYYPGSPGFIRNTLNARLCDVVIGMPQGDDIVQGTNPYYRTSYALVFKAGSDLEKIETLEDPRLKTKRIGIIAGTPPATNLAVNGLLPNIKSYPLVVDTRYDAPTVDMFRDLEQDQIDVAVLWGPIAGYFAKGAKAPMIVAPLVKETSGPRLIYRIGMGVRHSDQDWKRVLNRLISENQNEINAILASYGIPVLNEADIPSLH
jgi:quinoprotein dehydrogenase-associated probable ABC transporter substrate-binding protein